MSDDNTSCGAGLPASHRAGMADGFLTKTANRVRMQWVAFNADEQLFDQRRQLRSLLSRQAFEGLLQDRLTLGKQPGAALTTGNGQMKGDGSAIAGGLSCDEPVLLKALHEPHGARVGHAQHPGERVDGQAGLMADQGQRRRRAAAMDRLALRGVSDFVRQGERQCAQ
jgi:hypothetical protein